MAIYDINGRILSSDGGGSPIADKKILLMGDSNVAIQATQLKEYMESTYGCFMTIRATGGTKWETENGRNTFDDSAVGRVNTIVADITTENKITQFDYIIFHFGQNSGVTGDPTDDDTDVSEMCGAMKYCLKQMCYYGRYIRIGIVIPQRWVDVTVCREATEYPERYQEVLTVAQMYAVPVFDMWFGSRIVENQQLQLIDETGRDGEYLSSYDYTHIREAGIDQYMHRFGKWVAYSL